MADPRPWNDVAKGFDPNLPADQYDQLRSKYFHEVVVPRLGRGDDPVAAWSRFKQNTERKSSLTPVQSKMLPAAQAIVGISHALVQPLSALNPKDKLYKQQTDALENMQRKLLTKARREGKSVLPTIAGEMIGSTPAFMLAAETGGALLAGTGLEAIPVASRLLKGGAAFGLFESATAKEGDRLTAGVKGFATGVAFEGALGVGGRVFKYLGKAKYSKGEIDKIVANVLAGEQDPGPILDYEITKSIENDVRASKAEGRPQFIKEDPNTKGVSVLLHDAQDGAVTIKVRPGEERSAVKDILAITRKGGAVDGILHHPSSMETLQRFMRVSADEGSESYEGTRVLRTAEGQAPTIALEDELDGKATQAVSPNEIVVQDPHRPVPEPHEIEAGVRQLRDEEGYELSKGAQTQIQRHVKDLWDKGIPDERKEMVADKLRQWDLKDLVPEQWKREKSIEQITTDEVSGDDILKRAQELGVSEAELSRLQEVVGHEPARSGTQRWEPGLGGEGDLQAEARVSSSATKEGAEFHNEMLQQAKKELPNGSVSQWLRRAQELVDESGRVGEEPLQGMDNVHIPESETFRVEEGPSGPRKIPVGETPRRYALKVTKPELHSLIPGAEAATAKPGYLDAVMDRLGQPHVEGAELKPTVIYQTHPKKMTVFHEGLHVDKYHIPGATEIMQEEGNAAADSIAKGLSGARAYKALNSPEMVEEAYVHAASAIRMGDANYLADLVKMDGSIGDVFRMVNERSVRLLEAARTGIDSAQARIVQRKMQDLILRTTDNRAWELLNQTGKSLHDWWYNPEAKTWMLKSNERLAEETFDSYSKLVESVMAKEGGDWAPSASLFAEARGVRGAITPRGSGPVKDSVAMATPPDTKWLGWTTIAGAFRPMGPWVADLHQSVNDALSKFGRRLPIYDRWKDVDEAFRAGDTWLSTTYESAAKLLEGVDNKKQYAYFDVLSTDPKHWLETAKQMGLDEKDLTKINEIDAWLGKFRDDTNILVKNYLRDELPRLRGSGYDFKRVYGNFAKTRDQMSTFERLITDGKLDPKGRHIGSFMDTMMREGFSKKFSDKPLRALEKLVQGKAKNGQYILGNARIPLENYTKYMRGVPDVTAQVMRKTTGEFFTFLGKRAEAMNKHLPSYAQLPTEFQYPASILNKMMVWSYAAGLGLRASIPVRDTLQVFSTALPVLGPKRFLLGLTKGLSREGLEFAADNGALLQRRNIGELYGDIFNEIPVGASTDRLTKLANKLLAPSRWGHNAGRNIVFNGEYHSAIEAVRDYRAGRITIDELVQDRTSLWWNDKPVVDRIRGQIADPGFSDHDIAKNIGLEALDLTLWPYRRGTQPTILRTGAGRVFGQFGMWPLNYFDFLKRGAGKFAENPKNALQAVALWGAVNYASVSAMNGIGADVGKWYWTSPAAIEMSPHAKFIEDLAMSPKDSQEGREARRRVLEYPLDFFPAGIELKNIGRAWESDEDFFDGNDNLTPSALRVLGFTPLDERKEAASEDRDWGEEVLYQMGYSERRRGK